MSGPRGGNAGGPVTVTVPARLHVGFLDLEGGLGRRFGSLGIALAEPVTRVRLERGPPGVSGPDAERAGVHLERMRAHLGLGPRLHLAVEAAIPGHVGLGSGTQLALAVGVAASRLAGAPADARELAALLDRGARSGLGIASIEGGGVVLDGGRRPNGGPPPVIARLPLPEAWRVLLVLDGGRHGLHGLAEAAAIAALPSFPAARAAHLCRLMVMQALPALAEADLDGFGTAVAELQRVIGDHFAPAQGGRYLSPPVAAVLEWLADQGVRGVGQSSWGPTGFALIGSAGEAERLAGAASVRFGASGLRFQVVEGRNRGAQVEVGAPA